MSSAEPSAGDVDASETGAIGIKPSEAYDVISERIEIDTNHRDAKTSSMLSLRDIYTHLIERGETVTEDLKQYFSPAPVLSIPEELLFSDDPQNRDKWWDAVAEKKLPLLPGVERAGEDVWQFTGVDPAHFDEEKLRPLTEIRSTREATINRALDEAGVSFQGDRRETLVKLLGSLWAVTNATSEGLEDAVPRGGVSFDEIEGTLRNVPGVERVERHPPEPEEIDVETMADVIEGYERLEQDVTIEWSFDPDAVRGR